MSPQEAVLQSKREKVIIDYQSPDYVKVPLGTTTSGQSTPIKSIDDMVFIKPLDELEEEMICSPASLRGHIAKRHFIVGVCAYYGMARYDIEIAAYRGIPLDWVVKKAYENLERYDSDIQYDINKDARVITGIVRNFSVMHYRIIVVQTIKYIEQFGLASIDWDRVEKSLPGASNIKFDLERDSRDNQFLR